MPGVTPCVAIHYPLDTDPIDVAGDMEILAKDAATLICAIKNKQDAGVPSYASVPAIKTDATSDIATCLLQGHYRLCWRDGLNWFTEYTFTASARTTDANSTIFVGAAECGFTNLYSVVCNAAWSFDRDNTVQWGSGRVASNQAQIRVWGITPFGAEVFIVPAGVSVSASLTVAGKL